MIEHGGLRSARLYRRQQVGTPQPLHRTAVLGAEVVPGLGSGLGLRLELGLELGFGLGLGFGFGLGLG